MLLSICICPVVVFFLFSLANEGSFSLFKMIFYFDLMTRQKLALQMKLSWEWNFQH